MASNNDLQRQEHLLPVKAVAPSDVDKARALYRDEDKNRIAQLEADLATARLPARQDQIDAAEANVRAKRPWPRPNGTSQKMPGLASGRPGLRHPLLPR